MPNTFSLKIVATDRVFYDGRCEMLTVPALDGEFTMLAHHENIVIALDMGELRFRNEKGETTTALVGSGFAQMIHNRALVLVDSAVRPEEIDVERARIAKERAEEQLRQKQSMVEFHHSQASLSRAMARLKESSKYKREGY